MEVRRNVHKILVPVGIGPFGESLIYEEALELPDGTRLFKENGVKWIEGEYYD